MSEMTLEVQALQKKIGKRTIIKNLNFVVKKGEVFGFLGPNGAGKTATIRMLVGLIKPTAGSIRICGYDVKKEYTKAMQHLGCIVENPELYPFLSGWNNLLHFARMLPGIDEKRIEEVVELVGLQSRVHDIVKTYSLGVRQRLGTAQALLNRPKVLILDEPTNGLDPAGIREMRTFIRMLAEEEGMSVFVSSHLLSEIQLLCDRVAIITKGEIIKVDSVAELLGAQERMSWRVEPQERGKVLLRSFTDVTETEDGYLITTFDEEESPKWCRVLIEHSVTVIEMNRRLPTLEDLFLELTDEAGGTIE